MPFPFDQPFPFRDNTGSPITIVVEKHREGENDADWVDIPFTITYQNRNKTCYCLRFSGEYATTHGMKRTEKDSFAAEGIIKDMILSGSLRPDEKKVISIYLGSIDPRIKGAIYFEDELGVMKYRRDINMIIRENQIARRLLLKYAYLNESSSFLRSNIFESCHYSHDALERAHENLVTAGFIRELKHPTIFALTNKGQVEFENTYLRYSNSVFLIAACKDDVEETIKEVYKPVIEGEFGLKLIFQEREEPSKTIHEDIYDYIDNCKFIITDLTHHRPNCYYELGYARAKGKQIILCIEESDAKENGKSKLAFDTTPLRYTFYNMSRKDVFMSELRDRVNIVQSRLGSI